MRHISIRCESVDIRLIPSNIQLKFDSWLRLNQISRTYSFESTKISVWFGASKMRRLNRALDLIRSNFASLVYGNCRDTPCCKCFIHVKRKFWEKIRYFPSGNFRRLYSTNCQVIAYWRLKTNKQKKSVLALKKQTNKTISLSSKSGHGRGRLREVTAHMRLQIKWFDIDRNLVFWKTGRWGEVIAYERWL